MNVPLILEDVKSALDKFGTIEQVRSNRIK
jgi:hypothetical protein